MNRPIPAKLKVVAAAVLLPQLALAAPPVPAQDPLLIKATQVIPNLMYTLDDSPSMTSIYNPTDLGLSIDFTMPGVDGVVATVDTPYVAQMRSAYYNTQYYDPKIQYQPWALPDGTRMANADPTKALHRPNPIVPNTWPYEDLTTAPKDWQSQWCDTASPSSTYNCPIKTLTYVPGVYYVYTPGTTSNTTVKDFSRFEIMKISSFAKAPGRIDCKAATYCTQAEEMQNFANWFSYWRTRALTAIGGTVEAFTRLPSTARVGYGSLNALTTPAKVDGGTTAQSTIVRGIREFNGKDRDDFFKWIYNGWGTRGWTPTKRALIEVGNYFQRKDNLGPWGNTPGTDDGSKPTDHVACRRNFHVVVTDGIWNKTSWTTNWANWNQDYDNMTMPPASDPPIMPAPPITRAPYRYTPAAPYKGTTTWANDDVTLAYGLSDIAFYFWVTDLRDDLPNNISPMGKDDAFWQHITQYFVGLGFAAMTDQDLYESGAKQWSTTSRFNDVLHAAVNGHGKFLTASKPQDLAQNLNAILTDVNMSGTIAGVAASGRVLSTTTRKYVPSFESTGWSGDLTAQQVDSHGNTTNVMWTASLKLPTPALRNISYWDRSSSRARDFRNGSIDSTTMALLDNSTDLVDFLRGDRTREGTAYRKRVGVIGDTTNAAPLYVRDSADFGYDKVPNGGTAYRGFVQAMSNRPVGAVFSGSNDGMVHVYQESLGNAATKADDGKEMFAYIPGAGLGKLKALADWTYKHQFIADGPLSEAHGYWSGGWHDVVVGSTGAGATAVYAIDATDPKSMGAQNVMWEFNQIDDKDMGYVITQPVTGIDQAGRSVVLFGNGEGSTAGGSMLFVLNLQTGKVIKKLDTRATGGNGLNGVRVKRDATGQILAAYAGDVLGNLWKFDLSSPDESNWSVSVGGKPLFVAQDGNLKRQPITSAPVVVPNPDGTNPKRTLVAFATGRLFELADVANKDMQTLYGVFDDEPSTAIAGRGALTQQSRLAPVTITGTDGVARDFEVTTDKDLTAGSRGWYMDLTAAQGQRSVYPNDYVFGLMFFQTIFPISSAEICNPKASGSYTYVLDPMTGGMPKDTTIDTNHDFVVSGSDQRVAGFKSKADGGDVVMPVSKTAGYDLSSSSEGILIKGKDAPAAKRIWRQVGVPNS